MSGNGKIMCNHRVNLFKCQTCIDALVAEQIDVMQQRITELEQQLKTARADAVREFIPTIKAMDEPAYLKGRFQAELFWRGAFAAQKLAEEYVNNLEGR